MEREKKECILSAATRLFARFGFKKTSVDQIAKDAGVAKGTVYLAADTKEDLFYQAVHREVRAYTAEIAKLIDPRKAADVMLAETTLAGIQYLEERPLVRDLIFGNHQILLPEWADRLDELRALGRTNCAEIIRLGIRQGAVPRRPRRRRAVDAARGHGDRHPGVPQPRQPTRPSGCASAWSPPSIC